MKNLISHLFAVLVAVNLILGLSACANIFEAASNKTTEEALLEDATKAQNSSNFDTAISKIQELQASYPKYLTDPTTLMLLASAYAGKCGFNFGSYLDVVTTTSPGATPALQWLMNQWTTKTTDRTYCRLAEDTVKAITPTYVGRDTNQSFFMVLLGLAKTGIFLRELADTDRNGTADAPPFDLPGTNAFCAAGNISAAQITDIGTGLALVVSNLTNIGGALTGADLSGLTTVCAGLGAPAVNPCYLEDETAFVANAAYVKTIRSMLNVNALGGVGLVNGAPCP
jgi:hypothetical protein